MRVSVEAEISANVWRFGQAPDLCIYALNDFFTDEGVWVPRGTVGSDEPHLKQPCSITGDATLLIPSIELDSTPVDHSARYTAILKTRQRKVPFLSNFIVPPEPNNTTWPFLKTFQQLGRRFVNPPLAEIQRLVADMIASAITEIRFSSETRAGNAALTTDPVDPIFPIAVSANDPRWLAMISAAGVIVGSERSVMVDGEVLVDFPALTDQSKIVVTSMSDGVSGALRVVATPDVGFQIISNNLGDNGEVAWLII